MVAMKCHSSSLVEAHGKCFLERAVPTNMVQYQCRQLMPIVGIELTVNAENGTGAIADKLSYVWVTLWVIATNLLLASSWTGSVTKRIQTVAVDRRCTYVRMIACIQSQTFAPKTIVRSDQTRTAHCSNKSFTVRSITRRFFPLPCG